MSYLAAQTRTVTFVPTVASLPLRPPAMLAKAAASLDVLTSGRLQLGLGAGAFWEAIEAMGGPRRTKREAVDALDEAITVIRGMWSTQRSIRTTGRHYRVEGVHPGPAPSPNLGIWLGSLGPRMLALTGARADGWLPSSSYLPFEQLGEAVHRLDTAATDAARDPPQLRKVYNLMGIIGPENSTPFQGSVRQWADQITTAVTDHGMNGFVYWPADDHQRQIDVFAHEVVPLACQALPTR
ncbi:LLM class flavin-dependent oxidoreductase [Streptomyces sp. FXJ1.172]|uniref:LLM class flavin-dependent oxidoreductase n=1 Tax=Streptomyces sp. FXJ1.172 TaxID=710705 RepID=UPI001F427099|nr:LLM class flavin-dependent oxidoreductase [Streptomyces sp. FXJ1.172]WEP00473.1 LLM class flavin-dependent oxidoreductase [Streptomyces sp. FXJ1.172]